MDSPPAPTDLELLQAWQRGDTKGGNDLYQRYFATVHRYFANKVGSERDVEDLIQRTFLACMESRDRYAGQSTFRTWLLGIAHNLLCEHYRKRRGQPVALDFSEFSVRDLCDGPSTMLGQRREHRDLLDGLRGLPFDCQVVLELYYWEHLTGSELGTFLGVPENTARSKLRRAKALLLSALRNDNNSPHGAINETDIDSWAEQVRKAVFMVT